MIRARSVLAWTAAAALAVLTSAFGGQMSPGSAHTLIPAPVSVETPGGGDFVVSADTVIGVTPGDEHAAWVGRYLSDFIGLAAGAAPPRVDAAAAPAAGMIHLGIGPVEGGGDEGYQLTVSADRIVVTANHAAGLFYGVQTLRQLLPAFVESEGYRADETRAVRVAAIRIVDRPRFAWRGAMLDVARHFFSVDDVKRYIDLLALYKLNRLHLHLADDQGWRIEIKSWPNLTAHGGCDRRSAAGPAASTRRRSTAGHRGVRARSLHHDRARDRHAGPHERGARRRTPELNCDGVARPLYTGIEVGFSKLCVDKDITYKFIDDVVGEIARMTPAPYFHIGGDEVKTLTRSQYTHVHRARAGHRAVRTASR